MPSCLGIGAPQWVPARTPTVHWGPYAARPWVAHNKPQHDPQHDQKTSLESIVFSETSAVILSSCNHTDIVSVTPIENLTLKDWIYIRRINGLIKLKEKGSIFFGELDMRNRLFQESRARDCQEIVELRRICCEETDRARQIGIDELSLQQERYPTTESQLLTQIQDLQNKVNPCQTQETFTILRQRAALEGPTFPVNPLLFRAAEVCRAAILDCRVIHGIQSVPQETLLEIYLFKKDHPQHP